MILCHLTDHRGDHSLTHWIADRADALDYARKRSLSPFSHRVDVHAVTMPDLTPVVLCGLLSRNWTGTRWELAASFVDGVEAGEKHQRELSL